MSVLFSCCLCLSVRLHSCGHFAPRRQRSRHTSAGRQRRHRHASESCAAVKGVCVAASREVAGRVHCQQYIPVTKQWKEMANAGAWWDQASAAELCHAVFWIEVKASRQFLVLYFEVC
jgi:hypothetical protein